MVFGPGAAFTSNVARSYLNSVAGPDEAAAHAFTPSGSTSRRMVPVRCHWNCLAAMVAPCRPSNSSRVTDPLAGKAMDEPETSISNCAASGTSDVDASRIRSNQGRPSRSPPPILPPILPSIRHFLVSSHDALNCHSIGPQPVEVRVIPTAATIIRRLLIGILHVGLRLTDQLNLLFRQSIRIGSGSIRQSELFQIPPVVGSEPHLTRQTNAQVVPMATLVSPVAPRGGGASASAHQIAQHTRRDHADQHRRQHRQPRGGQQGDRQRGKIGGLVGDKVRGDH